jgi:hypothetical protein
MRMATDKNAGWLKSKNIKAGLIKSFYIKSKNVIADKILGDNIIADSVCSPLDSMVVISSTNTDIIVARNQQRINKSMITYLSKLCQPFQVTTWN